MVIRTCTQKVIAYISCRTIISTIGHIESNDYKSMCDILDIRYKSYTHEFRNDVQRDVAPYFEEKQKTKDLNLKMNIQLRMYRNMTSLNIKLWNSYIILASY